MAQWVKNSAAMQETQETRVQSLGWKGSLEEGTATHSSRLACKIPWTEEPGGLQSKGSQSRTQLSEHMQSLPWLQWKIHEFLLYNYH